MSKKKIIIASSIASVILLSLSLLYNYRNPESHSIEKHIETINDRMFSKSSEYCFERIHITTDSFPLFNEKGKLTHFVAEYKTNAGGFVYIKLQKTSIFTKNRSMYSVEVRLDKSYTDLDGVKHKKSHFQVGEVNSEEKRFLLPKTIDGNKYYIPAVIRNNKYLNLVSLEEMDLDYEKDPKSNVVSDIVFTNSVYNDLM